MGTERFCLQWNDYESNLRSSLKALRRENDFFDVTLACGGDSDNGDETPPRQRQIEAHKLILSASSPFFRTVLKQNPHSHPLLYLKGVSYSQLCSVVDFMYHGEVSVEQSELSAFLALAEDLKVKGLTKENPLTSSKKTVDTGQKSVIGTSTSTQSIFKKSSPHSTLSNVHSPKRQRLSNHPSSSLSNLEAAPDEAVSQHMHGIGDGLQEMQEIKDEPCNKKQLTVVAKTEDTCPRSSSTVAIADDDMDYVDYSMDVQPLQSSYDDGSACDQLLPTKSIMPCPSAGEELDATILEMMHKDPVLGWTCNACGKASKMKRNIECHIEANHLETLGNPCGVCGKVLKTRESLRQHMKNKHVDSNPCTLGTIVV